jgi:signal transduction histidine kinase
MAVKEVQQTMEAGWQEMRQLVADLRNSAYSRATGTFIAPSLRRTAAFLALSAVAGVVVTVVTLAAVPGSISQQIVRETPTGRPR